MRKLAGICAAGLIVLTACSGGNRNTSADGTPGPRATDDAGRVRSRRDNPPPLVHAASLERFDACPELLSHVKTEARKRVGPYGLPGVGHMGLEDGVAMDLSARSSAAAESSDAAAAPAPQAGTDFSGTNVQERGVDEPDQIKTDGRHIFTLRPDERSPANQRLVAIRPNDGDPRKVGDILLPEGQNYELLLAGDRILALGHPGYQVYAGRAMADMAIYPPQRSERTIIAIVDVSDPSDMEVTEIVRLEGSYASARLIDGIARIVLNTTQTGPEFEQPTEPTTQSQRRALEKNKDIIDTTDIKEWLPRFKVTDAKGTKRSEGPLASCATTYHPRQFSGFGNVSVVTIDPADPDPRNSASVLGSAGIVYASTGNLYVATQRWPEPQPLVIESGDDPVAAPEPVAAEPKTSIHRFDIVDPERAVYAASGEIDGSVLNQWSLSEHDGHLRVATTIDDFSGKDDATSSNAVTVLDATAPKLNVVGDIDGLGKNERIYGVRFIGDLGYIVTFRQIDPLHVIDFEDPEDPKLLGELKIPGYSAYLHPIGDTLLLGIGQDVAVGGPDEGRPLGVQMSLFDVADPREPKRIDQANVGGKNSYTPVEHDHHAFLWWDATSLAMVPSDSYDEQTGAYRGGAYAFRVSDRKITDIGAITHRNHVRDKNMSASIARSIVIGDDIYTLSAFGLMGSDLGSFDEQGFVEFPQFAPDDGGGSTEPGVVSPDRAE